jgi:pimeloyl-ACP methyl ester carboxylesterase
MVRMLVDTDVRAVLSSVSVPTLIVHRSDNKFLPVDHGRYVADHVPHAQCVELPGADQSPDIGDSAAILAVI